MIFRFHCLPPRLGCRSGIPLLLILFGGPDRVCAQAQFFFDDAPPLGSPATLVGTGGSFEFAADDGRYTISMSATGSLAAGGSLGIAFSQMSAISDPFLPSKLIQPKIVAGVSMQFEAANPHWAPGRYGVAFRSSAWGSVQAVAGFDITGSTEYAGFHGLSSFASINTTIPLGANAHAEFSMSYDGEGEPVTFGSLSPVTAISTLPAESAVSITFYMLEGASPFEAPSRVAGGVGFGMETIEHDRGYYWESDSAPFVNSFSPTQQIDGTLFYSAGVSNTGPEDGIFHRFASSLPDFRDYVPVDGRGWLTELTGGFGDRVTLSAVSAGAQLRLNRAHEHRELRVIGGTTAFDLGGTTLKLGEYAAPVGLYAFEVEGAAITFTNGLLAVKAAARVGNLSPGTMTIGAGAVVDVTGTPSSPDGLVLGASQSGTLIVTAGGRLNNARRTLVGDLGEGTLRVTGTEARAELNAIRVGQNSLGHLEALNGGRIETGEAVILGETVNGDGRLRVSGANAHLLITNDSGTSELLAASAGRAQLEISAGALLQAPSVRLALNEGAVAGLLVTGTNSRIETDNLRLGVGGEVAATFSDGARVTTDLLEMGTQATSVTTLAIQSGARLTLGSGVSRLAQAGRAEVDVGAGGELYGDGSILAVGSTDMTKNATLRLTGAGARMDNVGVSVAANGLFHLRDGALWTNTDGSDLALDVLGGRAIFQNANASINSLFVEAGGRVEVMSNAIVDVERLVRVDTGGRLDVSGTGARLVGPEGLVINGVVNVSNGGELFSGADGEIGVGGGGVLQGSDGAIHGDVIGASGATISPGNSPGALTFNGSLTMQPGSRLLLEIGGSSPGSGHDQIIVTGDLNLTGATVELAFIGGFAPVTGQSFSLLNVGAGFTGSPVYSITGLQPGWDYATGFNPETGGFSLTSLNEGLTAIPEPSTVGLILGTMAAAVAALRRRTSSP